MKKLLIFPLSLLLIIPPVHATDFSGQEEKYYKLCTSSTLSPNQQKKCQEFSTYLSNKNSHIQEDLSNNQNQYNHANDRLKDVKKNLDIINQKIDTSLKEMNYLDTSIKNYQKEIIAKQKKLKEKLYVMQSFYNSDSYLTYIWKAKNIVEFFSRLGSINDIANYEDDLVQEIRNDQNEVVKQLDIQKKVQDNLNKQKEDASKLEKQYIDLMVNIQKEMDAKKKESNKVSTKQLEIDQRLAALIDNSPSSSGGSLIKGSSAVGNKIAEKALSQLGKRYYWGATGPTYFDCSGLVYWAMNQAGISIGRTTSSGYAAMGKKGSRSELQAGDVITFSYGGGVEHIGIYIGGDSFVNALGPGSSIRGQYPQYCVKVCKLSGYWSNHVYNYRRLY